MNYTEYIEPELLVLIPVLYLIGTGIKKSKVADHNIPWILGLAGIVLSLLYILSVEGISGSQGLASAFFSALTQGVLAAGASVYANQLIKQAKEGGTDG